MNTIDLSNALSSLLRNKNIFRPDGPRDDSIKKDRFEKYLPPQEIQAKKLPEFERLSSETQTNSKSADFDEGDKIFCVLERMYIEALVDNVIKEKNVSTQEESEQNSSIPEVCSRECIQQLQIGLDNPENEQKKVLPEINYQKNKKILLQFKNTLRGVKESFSALKAQANRVLSEERLKLNFGMERLLESGLKKFLLNRKKVSIQEIKRVHLEKIREKRKAIKKESVMNNRISNLFQGLKAVKKVKQEAEKVQEDAKELEDKMDVEFTILEEVPPIKPEEPQQLLEQQQPGLKLEQPVGQMKAELSSVMVQESKTSEQQSHKQEQIEQNSSQKQPVIGQPQSVQQSMQASQKPCPKKSKKAKTQSKILEVLPTTHQPMQKVLKAPKDKVQKKSKTQQSQPNTQPSQPQTQPTQPQTLMQESDTKQLLQVIDSQKELKPATQVIPSKPLKNTQKGSKKDTKYESNDKPLEKLAPPKSNSEVESLQKAEKDRMFAKPQLSQPKNSPLIYGMPSSDMIRTRETIKVPTYFLKNHDPNAELPAEIVKDLKRAIAEIETRQQRTTQAYQPMSRYSISGMPEYSQRNDTQIQKLKNQPIQYTQKEPAKPKDLRSAGQIFRAPSGNELNLSATNSSFSSVINEKSKEIKPLAKQKKSKPSNSNAKEDPKAPLPKEETKEPFEIKDDSDSPQFEIIGSPESEHALASKPNEQQGENTKNIQTFSTASANTAKVKDLSGKQETPPDKASSKKKGLRKPIQHYFQQENLSDEEDEPWTSRTRSSRGKKVDEEFSVPKTSSTAINAKNTAAIHPMLQKKREIRTSVRYDDAYY